MQAIGKFGNFFRFLSTIKLNRVGYRYSLHNIKEEKDGTITLFVLVSGIKKSQLTFKVEEIISDDDLLSEFSPCDVRAITYLSFQKYLNPDNFSLRLDGQLIKKGKTSFIVIDLFTNQTIQIEAKLLYQDYDFLNRLSKKDMISVISTAVQEQTISDISSIR